VKTLHLPVMTLHRSRATKQVSPSTKPIFQRDGKARKQGCDRVGVAGSNCGVGSCGRSYRCSIAHIAGHACLKSAGITTPTDRARPGQGAGSRMRLPVIARRANRFRFAEFVSIPGIKNNSLFQKAKSALYRMHPVPLRGALAIVTTRGGERWTRKCL